MGIYMIDFSLKHSTQTPVSARKLRSALVTGTAGLSISPDDAGVGSAAIVGTGSAVGYPATGRRRGCHHAVRSQNKCEGEPKINHWADLSEIERVGNIEYAPVANNRALFERYGSDMLVINGVDSQTNSHETGKLFNWTGANNEGQPSMSALFAAAQAPEQPLAYSVFGGLSRTAGIIGYNRFDDLSVLRGLTQPNVEPWSGQPKRWHSEDRACAARCRHRIERECSTPM